MKKLILIKCFILILLLILIQSTFSDDNVSLNKKRKIEFTDFTKDFSELISKKDLDGLKALIHDYPEFKDNSLKYSLNNGFYEIVPILMESGAKKIQLHIDEYSIIDKFFFKSTESLTAYLQAGYKINLHSYYIWLEISKLYTNQKEKFTDSLIELIVQSSLHPLDKTGNYTTNKMPLDFAVDCKLDKFIKPLVQNNAKICYKDSDRNFSTIDLAIEVYDPNILNELIHLGAIIDYGHSLKLLNEVNRLNSYFISSNKSDRCFNLTMEENESIYCQIFTLLNSNNSKIQP